MSSPASLAAAIGLPASLRNGDATVSTDEALAGAEYVALYFSAHWCAPCRGFTPRLSDFVAANADRLKLKVVFVSADRSEKEFDDYRASMSFKLALPFGVPEKAALNEKYEVEGIPTLVLLDAHGKVVTADARDGVMEHPDGAGFPWRPRALWEILGEATLVDKAGVRTPAAALKAKGGALGLYFSAHWCGPCRAFTPELAKWYEERVTAAGGKLAGKLDLVFVSSDKDVEAFDKYRAEMPWQALAFENRATKAELSKLFKVEGIPTLVIVDAEGAIITEDGRAKVSSDPDGFPWPPAARDPLSFATSYINTVPTLVLFTDMVTDPVSEVAAVEALDAVAAEYYADGKPSPRIRFALAADGDEAVDSVRGFLGGAHTRDKNGPEAVRATIVDIRGRRKALYAGGALLVPSAADLSAWVKSFLDGSAETVGIKD